MLYTKIKVRPNERAIIMIDGQFVGVREAGEHTIWHFNKKFSFVINELSDLTVHYSDVQNVLRFQRELAQAHWQIIDSPMGYDTLVWNERYLEPQIVPSGESRAFWRVADGEIHTHVLGQNDFRLPENIEKALLTQKNLNILKKYTVKANEKMLITVRDQLQSIDGEGEYLLRLPDEQVKVLFASNESPEYRDFKMLQTWATQKPDLIAQYFDFIETKDDELLLYSVGGALTGWIAPNCQAYFWKQTTRPYKIQRIDLKKDLQISADIVAQLYAINFSNTAFAKIIHVAHVPSEHQALVYLNFNLYNTLSTGEYLYWQLNQKVSSQLVDLRSQTCSISGQELLSEDKVTLRVNAVCNYRVTDAPVWLAQHSQPDEYLYRELQFAIRALMGSRSIDKLLSEKQMLDDELSELMKAKQLKGIDIQSAGIKDIILPGEIRDILTKVVEAEKSAQANNIRRREETASTRSLLNTARVMEENPTALRLKELETLEKVTEKIDKISVYGGLDGVLNNLIHIGKPKS